mgnify:CR=1 FL=1
MSSSEPISSLKGIGEKTGKLFEKLGSSQLMTFFPIIQELTTLMKQQCL